MDGSVLTAFECRRRSALAAGVLSPLLWAGCQPGNVITGSFTGTSLERGHLLREPYSARPSGVTRTVHTLIAGGGVAGLSAARALRLQGMEDFALLELENETGGNSRAGSMAGMAHPMGAHYLPVPSDAAPETQDFLEELGLRQRIAGRWQYDERHLCHSPQERLYIDGVWQEGLLPVVGVGKATLAQYAQFAQVVERWRATGGFQIPVPNTLVAQQNMAQLAMPFVAYLNSLGLHDTYLRWYLDYCCRDDYGAGIDVVCAWAGIHYFAARHGFSVPLWAATQARHSPSAQSDAEQGGVLTWPEGNAFLTRALAKPLGSRVYSGRVVLRIAEGKTGVTVDALNVQTQAVERWQATRCIVALPIFVANRVVENPPNFLSQAAQAIYYSSWLVANIHINAALHDSGANKNGAPASWDNVIYNPAQPNTPTPGSTGLGYVDAMHQSTRTAPGPSVLTYYRALGIGVQAQRSLWETTWERHRDASLADLALAHPDIGLRTQRVDITRYGHAMAVPSSGFWKRSSLYSNKIKHNQLLNDEHKRLVYAPRSTPSTSRLRFAHSDWSGYSVFEEAFTRGLHAAMP